MHYTWEVVDDSDDDELFVNNDKFETLAEAIINYLETPINIEGDFAVKFYEWEGDAQRGYWLLDYHVLEVPSSEDNESTDMSSDDDDETTEEDKPTDSNSNSSEDTESLEMDANIRTHYPNYEK
jgi:hypothetical protein